MNCRLLNTPEVIWRLDRIGTPLLSCLFLSLLFSRSQLLTLQLFLLPSSDIGSSQTLSFLGLAALSLGKLLPA